MARELHVHVSLALASHLVHAGTVIAAILHQIIQQQRIPLHRLHCDSLLRAFAEGWIAHMLRHICHQSASLGKVWTLSEIIQCKMLA